MIRANVWTVLSIVLLILGLWLLFDKIFNRVEPIIQKEYVQVFDTVRIRDTIFLQARAKIKVIKDTVFEEKIKPLLIAKDTIFEACLDTSVKNTQVSLCYFFPTNVFALDVKTMKDTVVKVEMIKIEQTKRNYWEYGVAFGVGLILGLLIR